MAVARSIIERLLAKGRLEAAIEGGLLLARHYSDEEKSAAVAQHAARFHTLMSDYNAGTVSDEDYRLERARISRAMIEWAQEVPGTWTDAPLKAAGFSADKWDGSKSKIPPFIGWIALIAVLGILAWVFRAQLFPDKKPQETTTQTQTPTQTDYGVAPARPQVVPAPGPARTPQKAPDEEPVRSTTTPEGKFRSFAKTVIREDMERGYIGDKIAFRNVRTKEIVCCFSNAEDFADGKAYVSEDGVKYFYIDKKGNKLK